MKVIQQLTSVQPIDKVLETQGSQPVEVLCSDFHSYICKYRSPSPQMLVKEFLASHFLSIWGILTPEIALVKIFPQHLPLNKLGSRQSLQDFSGFCFGSRIMANVEDMRPDFAVNSLHLDKTIHRTDWLQIALFDIWLANEDRTSNNLNLLLQGFEAGPRRLVAIDHAAIFNTGFLIRELVPLTLEDSILYAPIVHSLFKKSLKSREEVERILVHFESVIPLCKNELGNIIEAIPDDWLNNKSNFLERCTKSLFSEEWLKTVSNTFRTFVVQVNIS